MFIYYLAIGAVIEEIIFRGLIIDIIRSYFIKREIKNKFIPVIISNVIWLGFHLHKYSTLKTKLVFSTLILVNGLLLWLAKEKTGRLYYSTLLHVLYNTLT